MSDIIQFRPGAKAFIVHQGKVLIVKEKVLRNEIQKIIWDVPGGGVEGSESLHETVLREVYEEVGLRVRIVKPAGCWGYQVQKGEKLVHAICTAYQCEVIGEPVIDTTGNPAQEDIFETVWMTKAEIIANAEAFEVEDLIKSLENVTIA